MHSRTRTEVGLLLLTVAVGLMLAAALATDVITLLPALSLNASAADRTFVSQLLGLLLGLAVPIAAMAIGAGGFLEIWRERREPGRGPTRALARARFAGALGVAALGGLLASGVFAGFFYLGPASVAFSISRAAAGSFAAVALGLFLLWAVRDMAPRGAARLALVAFGSGAVAASVSFVLRASEGLGPAADPLFLAERIAATSSIGLWLLAYVAAMKRVRSGDAALAVPVAPSQPPSDTPEDTVRRVRPRVSIPVRLTARRARSAR